MNRQTLLAAALACALGAPAVSVPARAAACAAKHTGPWTQIPLPATVNLANTAVAFGHPDTVFALLGRKVVKSTDDGCTWKQAVSLDEASSTSLARLEPTYAFQAISASEPDASGHSTVWALALDPNTLGATSVPPTFATSADSGAHWTFVEAPLSAGLATYPRCSASGPRISAGADPASLLLKCAAGLDQLALTFFGPLCGTNLYVTHDRGKTWTVTSQMTWVYSQGSCQPAQTPVVDRVKRGVVWDLQDVNIETTLLRSEADGADLKPYLKTRAWDWFNKGFDGTYLPNGTSLGTTYDAGGIQYTVGGKVVRKPPPLPIRARDQGYPAGVAFLPGTTRIVVTYFDAYKRARLFVFDITRLRWQELAAPPRDGKNEAWSTTATATFMTSRTSNTVYIRSSKNFLYRVRTR